MVLFLDQINAINCFMCNPGSITVKWTIVLIICGDVLFFCFWFEQLLRLWLARRSLKQEKYLTVMIIYVITAPMGYSMSGLRNFFVPISTNPGGILLCSDAVGSDNDLRGKGWKPLMFIYFIK